MSGNIAAARPQIAWRKPSHTGHMPLYREEGVVLRTQKLGEADRIVTLLTRERGLLRAVAKGVRRTSSKFGARLEPFMVADIQCYEGRTLDTITQAETLGAYGAKISADYDVFRAGNIMVETAEKLSEGAPARSQYVLLVGALRSLAAGESPWSLVRDAYLLRAVGLAGWAPGFDECVRCGTPGPHTNAVIQLGGVVCRECTVPGSPRLNVQTVSLLSALLTGDWPAARDSAESTREQAAGFTAAYTQFHLERGLRSMNIGDGKAHAVVSRPR
jgi:DNA repair protein RecO (recombination protein O)